MSSEIFLPLETEQFLLLCERILFVISSLSNIIALFCLVRETPRHQLRIRSYLLFIQVTVIATDVYFSLLFEPFPVLQVFAGYCAGILCNFLQPTVVVGIYAAMVGAMGASILICTIHRHQTIVMRGPFMISERARTVLQWLLYLLFCGPCLAFAAIPFDREDSERLINKTVPDVSWMKDRGGYFMLERTFIPIASVAIVLALLILSIVIALTFAGHMFLVLELESSGKSARFKRSIRISLVRFLIQMFVPFAFIILPMMAVMSEILFQWFSFGFCIFVASVIPFHPIAHNVILILVVPEYRRYFYNRLPICLRGKRKISVQTTMETTVATTVAPRRLTLSQYR